MAFRPYLGGQKKVQHVVSTSIAALQGRYAKTGAYCEILSDFFEWSGWASSYSSTRSMDDDLGIGVIVEAFWDMIRGGSAHF